MNKQNKTIFIGVIAVVVIAVIIFGSIVSSIKSDEYAGGKSLDQLLKKVDYTEAELVKASISMNDTSLYDELPEIDKYPLAVDGNGQIDIEIFTSGEKAGEDNDSWLIKVAKEFNNSDYKTSDGNSISISVRSVSSGMGADYIIARKYLPDLYTPSNELFGEYCMVKGGKLELYNARLVGNTAGVLVEKDSSYKNIDDVIKAVQNGEINIGYTNPQTSATGLNLLIEILKNYGDGTIDSEKAIKAFTSFNSNIPYIAYTTQQMRDSASDGSLNGMVSEYQAYINDHNLTSLYKFIPFGVRHDNPLYIVDKSSKSSAELEAIEIINDYLTSSDAQKVATEFGFNADDKHVSSYSTSGAEVTKALEVYKNEKDNGQDIIAVFVADKSGSMDGEPMHQLKQSLSNGMQYINSNNYVGLVSYSTDVTIEVPIAKFDLNQKAYFQGALNRMQAGGNTSSYEAICVALDMITKAKEENPDAKCMIFLLSDGDANGWYSINDIKTAVYDSKIPVYTIGYTSHANMDELGKLSNINEAASINADSDDIVYKIKSLFNSQL